MKEVNESNFEKDVLQSDIPVLVDFWAAWGASCRLLTPIVETVAEKYGGRPQMVKLNVDPKPVNFAALRSQGIPTLIMLNDGAERQRVLGVTSEEAISLMIEKYSRASDS